MSRFNIIVCGVGGSGVIGLGNLLRSAGHIEGMQVMGAESRGSAQRGGVVTSSVRYMMREEGEKQDEFKAYWLGAIPVGGADLMIATEASETLRNAHYLNDTSRVILNTFTLTPKPGRKGKTETEHSSPSITEIVNRLKEITRYIYVIDASEMSMKRYRSYLMTNFILLGMALAHGELPLKKKTLSGLLKEKAREALEIGLESKPLYIVPG